jgi:tyrosyl-tRNA synthetase
MRRMEIPVGQQVEQILDGVEEFLPSKDDLRERLTRKKTLRIKLGLDPTHTDLTVGHAVVLQKLRRFQNLGHTVVLIIGDFTALVGDPSGRSKARPQLTEAEIAEFGKTFADQAGRILDMGKVELRHNSEWLAKLTMKDAIQLAQKITVSKMLERQDFGTRYKNETPIFVHEFLYALLQGYDSVAVQCDIEIGATEQKFNLLMGREIMPDFGQQPQMVLMMPILVGLDGVEKMSKSKGNYIALTDTPTDMFGKVMSIPDNIIGNYFRVLLERSKEEVAAMEKAMKAGENPMKFKLDLAEAVTAHFHSPQVGAQERESFQTAFSGRDMAAVAEEVTVPGNLLVDGRIDVVRLLIEIGAVKTGNEARRLLSQGAVKLDGRKLTTDETHIALKGGELLEVGKKKAYRLANLIGRGKRGLGRNNGNTG